MMKIDPTQAMKRDLPDNLPPLPDGAVERNAVVLGWGDDFKRQGEFEGWRFHPKLHPSWVTVTCFTPCRNAIYAAPADSDVVRLNAKDLQIASFKGILKESCPQCNATLANGWNRCGVCGYTDPEKADQTDPRDETIRELVKSLDALMERNGVCDRAIASSTFPSLKSHFEEVGKSARRILESTKVKYPNLFKS